MSHGHEHQKDVTCVGFPCSLIIVNPKHGLHAHPAKKLKMKATSRPSEKERGFVLVFTHTILLKEEPQNVTLLCCMAHSLLSDYTTTP